MAVRSLRSFWPAVRARLLPLAGCAALVALPWLFPSSTYFHYILALTAVYGIAALGLNLLIGVAGQISLGHAAFMAIGAYTSALLTLKAGLPFPAGMAGAAVVSAAVGLLMGLPALRLHGPYLALATISFGAAVPEVLLKWERLTGGHAGLLPAKPAIGPLRVQSEASMYVLALAVAAVIVWLTANLLRSCWGRAWRALREAEIAAQSMGVNLALAKTSAFAISAAYAGVAGGLYAHLVGFISPFDFNLFISAQLLAMIVLGGLGSIAGAMTGAAALTALLQMMSRTKGWSLIAEGAAIVFVVWFMPLGLAGLGRHAQLWWRRCAARRGGRAAAATTGAEGVSERRAAAGG